MGSIKTMPMPHGSCMEPLKDVQIVQWNPKTGLHEKVWRTITCDKVTDPGEELCPHHLLIASEFQNEQGRKMQRVRNGKERKALLRGMLETSPLSCPQSSAFTANAYQE